MTAGLLSFGRTVSASPTFQITWVNADNTWVNAPAGWTTVRDQFTIDMGLWFSPTINLVIDIGYNTVHGNALGGSGSSGPQEIAPSYASVKAAMLAIPTYASSTLPSSIASFGTTSPIGQVLGLNGPASPVDGYVGFSSGTSWDLSTNGSCAGGLKSFYGEIFHEVTEVMGRFFINSNVPSSQSLFSYTSAGVFDNTDTHARYFSDDGGVTNLGTYNHVSNGGDFGDWASLGDNCDFSVATGTSGIPTQRDMRLMAAMGWNLTAAGRTLAGL